MLLIIFLLSYCVVGAPRSVSYVANMRFVVGLTPEPGSGQHYAYDRYYTWLTAEYLLDDLAEVVMSSAFAQDVGALAGSDVATGVIRGITSAGKLHRILAISMTWHDRAELERMANAAARVLLDQGDAYFAQLSTDSAAVSLIDPPTISPVAPSLRQRLDLPLRIALALATGIGLTFLLDYLDDSIRDRSDLEKLGIPILAEVPTRKGWHSCRGWLARLWHRRSRS